MFIATSEWQTIKKHQGIPRGLHVRLNVQTGEKEAKLMDSHQNNEKLKSSLEQIDDGDKNDAETLNNPNIFRSYEELKDQLKDVELNLQTDAEIIKQLISNFNSSTSKTQKLEILNDLEYYVHKVKINLLEKI